MNINKTLSTVKIIVLALILAVGVQYVLAQVTVWSSAPANPPNGNTDAPINVGASLPKGYQEKLGALHINTAIPGSIYGLDVWGIARFYGGFVIENRTANPTANLDTGRMWLIVP